MAEIVAAIACAHTPMMAVRPAPDGSGMKERFYAALREARGRLERVRPDMLVVVSNEHLQNWFFGNWPALAIAYPETMEGPFERHLPMPRYQLRGYPAFGRYLVEAALAAHFDPSWSEEFEPDHGVMLPLYHLRPQMDLPVTLVLQNCVHPPMPTLRRCQAFGRLLGEAIARWPQPGRVALIGVGGLSHWIGIQGMGRVNADWDRWFLERLCAGDGEALGAIAPEELARDAGNGGEEIRNWLAVQAAVGNRPAELLAYEPITDWLTGSAVVYWDLAA